eukprot:768492-Hanusia_phi.AAC.2
MLHALEALDPLHVTGAFAEIESRPEGARGAAFALPVPLQLLLRLSRVKLPRHLLAQPVAGCSRRFQSPRWHTNSRTQLASPPAATSRDALSGRARPIPCSPSNSHGGARRPTACPHTRHPNP